jgi:hypothetical protein
MILTPPPGAPLRDVAVAYLPVIVAAKTNPRPVEGYLESIAARLEERGLREVAARLRTGDLNGAQTELTRVAGIPLRTEITVLGPDDPNQKPLDWTMFERNGFPSTNSTTTFGVV